MPHRTGNVFWLDARRQIPADKVHDERASSPLGRFNLVGAISDDQYNAGMHYRRDVLQYRRILDIRPYNQSIAGFGQPCPPMPADLDDDRIGEIRDRYARAFEAVGGDATPAIHRALKHVIIFEEELEPSAFKFLDAGLNKLILHYSQSRY